MLEKTHYYPGQKTSEEIILFLRRHWIAYAKWIAILALLIMVPSIILVIGLQTQYINFNSGNNVFYLIIITIYILFLLALFITTWIDYYLDVTIVTREHLINIKQNELFSRSVAEQSLLRVQDVSSKKTGFFQTYFNFGTVLVETAGEQPNFKMTNIEDPHVVASTVMRIHEELLQEHEEEGTVGEELGMETLGHRKQSNNEYVEKPPLELIDIDEATARKEFHIKDKKEKVNLEKLIEDKGENDVITIQKSNNIDKSVATSDIPEVVKIEKVVATDNGTSSIKENKFIKADDIIGKNNPLSEEGELKEGEDIKL